MRIDTHTHVWNLDAAEYSWLTPDFAPLDRTYDLGEVERELDECGITDVVLVQAADNDEDTDNLLRVAGQHPRVAGVVAWMPLADPTELDRALVRRTEHPIVVGVRCLIHDMADTEWIVRGDVGAGLDRLAQEGLSFDFVTSGPEALAHAVTIADRHPKLRIIIDHLGKPPIGGSATDRGRWRALLGEVGARPNVAAKLSGLYSSVGAPDSWTDASVVETVNSALEIFGPDRLMYGGDWPVAILGGGYRRVYQAIERAVAPLSDSERDAIFAGTALNWYRLPAQRDVSS